MLLYPDVLVSFKVHSILPSKHANAMWTFVSKLPQEQLASNRTKEVKVVFRMEQRIANGMIIVLPGAVVLKCSLVKYIF